MEREERGAGTHFGNLLRRFRLASGLSQEALAERAQMSTNGISALERGYRRTPQRATLALLTRGLALDEAQRREFEAAALRAAVPHRRGSVTIGPWPDALAASLPLSLASFEGRQRELDEIAALLREHRLVTITGAGGVGKTQTALRASMATSDALNIAVCYAELAPIGDSSLLTTVIATALGVQEAPDRPLRETLIAFLKNKTLLLLLDNCEHVLSEAASHAEFLLHACPDLRILATSRERLKIAGEHCYRLPPLDENSAVALFQKRARSAHHAFALTTEEAPIVAEICRRLDGIPLGIELAAARAALLSLKTIAARLNARFALLTGGSRTAVPRQQTMRALIDWSYDLLSEREQTAFRKLSIFASGFTLQTAAAVCGEDDAAMLDRITSLVEKSLLQAEPSAYDTRYRMLESVREYARCRLVERGENDAAANAHANALLTLASQLDASCETTPDQAWEAQAEPELENWRAALAWALGAGGDVAAGLRLTSALRVAWVRFAPVEGRRWVLLAAQSADGVNDGVSAGLELAEGRLHFVLHDYRAACATGERALAAYRRLGDERGIALAQRIVASSLVLLGREAEGEALALEALEVANAFGMRETAGFILVSLAVARVAASDFEGARSRLTEALVLARTDGFERLAKDVAMNLAEVEFLNGDALTALRLARESLEIHRDAVQSIMALNNSVMYLLALGRYDEGRAAAREVLTRVADQQNDFMLIGALQHVAVLAELRSREGTVDAGDQRARAARLIGYVDAWWTARELKLEWNEKAEYEKLMKALRDALGDDELAKYAAQGRAWSTDRAVAEAMLV